MHVLCIEDDIGLQYLLRKSLQAENIEVTLESDGEKGLFRCQQIRYDLIVVDNDLPTLTGLEVILRLKASQNSTPIIMVTGAGNEEVAVEALRAGAANYLVKDTAGGYLKLLPTVIRQVINEQEAEKRHREAELALHLEQERSIILRKFIQDASHEFRTPLTQIRNACYLLGKAHHEPKADQFVVRIEESVDMIVDLVDELTKLAMLDSVSSLKLVEADLSILLRDVISRRQHLIAEKQIQFQLDYPDETLEVLADSSLLGEALFELLDNACQFSSPNGKISLMIRRQDLTAVITIEDNGAGISDDHLVHVFSRFYRVDEAHSTRGFGLGLPIAERIIDLHHGKIDIQSALGTGTTVIVQIPISSKGF